MASSTSPAQRAIEPEPVSGPRHRVSLWLALILALIGLGAFVALFNLLPDLGAGVGPLTLIGLGLVLSIVPAALWLGFFYRLDRLEPEPKQMVLRIALLGALVTAALHGPLLDGLFGIEDWLYEAWWVRLLGGILVVGMVEQFLLYLTVRFGIYEHPEFDERSDGILYAMAAGLGLATVLNMRYVIERGGVDLDIGAIHIVINALAFASIAGVQGYFLGQARFETTPIYYLPGGTALAAVLNGLFFFFVAQSSESGLAPNPWWGLLFATLVAVATLALVFWLIERSSEETLRVQGPPASSEPSAGSAT